MKILAGKLPSLIKPAPWASTRTTHRQLILKTVFLLIVLLLLLPFKSAAKDIDISKVHDAIKEAVGDSGANIEVILQGSHVTGKNFVSPLKGGTSDFDMRLAFKNKNVSPTEAIQEWKAFRERLKRALKNQYPDQADLMKILESTNVYPPEQLMQGVTGRSDAINRLKSPKINTVPNLLHDSAEALDDKTFKELAGGLYGETTEKATRQAFEKNVGKVITKDSSGKVHEALADLTHLAEGEGVYTIRGAGNAASQWLDDAFSAMKSANYKNIAKNVERAKILLKGKDLARVPLSANDRALKNAADEMAKLLKEFGDEALDEAGRFAFAERVKAIISKYNLFEVLKEARMDAECMRLGDSKFARLVAAGLLERSGKWAVLAENFKQLWANIPEGSFPAALNALVVTFEVASASEKAAADGFEKAAASLGINIAGIYSGPIGWAQLASTITVAVLDIVSDYVKDRVYEFTAGFQKCSDLIAGVYTVKGRETQADNTSSLTTCHKVDDIRDLACSVTDMEAVVRLVECHAGNAARRFEGGGKGEKETEQGIISALTRKCGKDGNRPGAVLNEWLTERELLKREFDDFLRNFDSAPLYVETMPSHAETAEGTPITVQMKAEIEGFDEKQFLSYLQCFGGKTSKPSVFTDYKWAVNGALKETKTLPSVELDFEKPGEYMIDVAVEIRYVNRLAGIDKYLSKGVSLPFVVGKKVEKSSSVEKDKNKDSEGASTAGKTEEDGDKKPATTAQVQPDSYTKGFGKQGVRDVPSEGQPPSGEVTSGKVPVQTPPGAPSPDTPTPGPTASTPTATTPAPSVPAPSVTTPTAPTPTTPGPTTTVPTSKDPKSQAEERYKWIKDVLDYYEKLIELEKKAFQAFEKQVREFVMKKAAAGGYPVRDKETEKKIERLEEELKNVGVYVVKERTTDPLTGESFLGNVIKGKPPTSAEKAKAEELAELKDPMSHEEFQCLDKGLQVRRDRLPEIKQKANTVRESKLYNNFAEYSAWNQYKEYLSEIASLKSRLNLPDPIPSPVTLPWSYSSKCGSAGGGTAEGERTLSVRLQTDKTKLKAGETVNVKAVVEGGKPEYTYSWTGDHAGKGEAVQFSSKTPGSYTLSVTATDKTGKTVSDSVTFNVDDMTVRIFKAEPSGNKIRVGGQAKFRAELSVDGKTATGDFIYRWQPHPEITFSKLDSTSGDIDAIFTKLGKTKVWVQVLEKKGNVLSTIAESNQIEIEVIQPKLSLTTNNENPNVGDMVVLTVHEDPKMGDDVISFWWEYSGNAGNPGPAPNIPNSRAYSLKPKDTKPITVTVHGKTKDGKDDLGEEKATITAQSYTITVTGPKAAGPKPKIWKCDTQLGGSCPGLVEVDKEIAVHQRVEFSAEVSPKPETDLRYNWTVSGSSCTLSNPITRDVGVTCSETGSHQMTVTVRNKENIELGQGAGNLAVTISQEELNTAAAKAKPKVTVAADKTVLTIGESTSATATVDGGKSPYNYKWTGDYEGQGPSVRFSPKTSGDHTLSVEVTDAAGNKGSANITFKVEALKVTIEGLRDEVIYGTKLSLSVTPEGHQMIWKSEPSITFTPQQSLGGKTIASFNSIGRVKVWAVAQQNTGVVIGESEKKEINVIPPKFEITFDPLKGKVGDEITATVKTVPQIDKSLLKFVWESPRRSDIKPYDTNIVRFTPKSIAPVEFLVIAKEPVRSQSLAEIRGTYTAEAVRLDVVLKADKTRLKPGEAANIRADVKGGKTPYTFNWKGDYKGYGSAVRFYAQKSGQQRLYVDVIDAMGNRGSANIKLDVDEIHLDKPYDKGPAKTPTVLTPFPPPGMLGHPQEEYDPRKDSGFTGPGAGPTSSDVASANTVGSEFQQGFGGGSKATTEQTPQNVTQQPESYTTNPGKKPDSPTGTQQPYYPPSPQGYPPDSGQFDIRAPRGGLVGPSSGYSAKSSGGSRDPGTSAPSLPSTPPSSNIRSSGTSVPSPPSPKPIASVTAEITNRSKGNVHIFTDGETFGPGNRFESGNMKRVNVRVPSNNKITFYAGRNGQIIASKSWYYDPNNPNSIPVVIFDESNPYDKLVIMKGLR